VTGEQQQPLYRSSFVFRRSERRLRYKPKPQKENEREGHKGRDPDCHFDAASEGSKGGLRILLDAEANEGISSHPVAPRSSASRSFQWTRRGGRLFSLQTLPARFPLPPRALLQIAVPPAMSPQGRTGRRNPEPHPLMVVPVH